MSTKTNTPEWFLRYESLLSANSSKKIVSVAISDFDALYHAIAARILNEIVLAKATKAAFNNVQNVIELHRARCICTKDWEAASRKCFSLSLRLLDHSDPGINRQSFVSIRSQGLECSAYACKAAASSATIASEQRLDIQMDFAARLAEWAVLSAGMSKNTKSWNKIVDITNEEIKIASSLKH